MKTRLKMVASIKLTRSTLDKSFLRELLWKSTIKKGKVDETTNVDS